MGLLDFSLPTPWALVFVVLGVFAVVGLVFCLFARRAPLALVGMSLIGYAIAVFFALSAAPDLAMTQFAVESLGLFVFLAVLARGLEFDVRETRRSLAKDSLIAIFVGGVVFVAALLVLADPGPSRLRDFFSSMSLSQGHGRNVVNVILVDFRGFDTLGEITVLGIVALAGAALLWKRGDRKERGR